ncbi:MAG: hypothetical protein FWG10_10640 [Eubacteriaceae bacterium]|nr:hypothetical protein [Eubacteriaceae bacterium]
MGWICKVCGAENPINIEICEVCDAKVDIERIQEARRQEVAEQGIRLENEKAKRRQAGQDAARRVIENYLIPLLGYGRYAVKLAFYGSIFAVVAGLFMTFSYTQGVEYSLLAIYDNAKSIVIGKEQALPPITTLFTTAFGNLKTFVEPFGWLLVKCIHKFGLLREWIFKFF